MDFERLGLCEELIKAISLEGWEYKLIFFLILDVLLIAKKRQFH